MEKKRIHMNWSKTRQDWDTFRRKLYFLKTIVYGNFLDVNGDPDTIKSELNNRNIQIINEFENYANYDLYWNID